MIRYNYSPQTKTFGVYCSNCENLIKLDPSPSGSEPIAFWTQFKTNIVCSECIETFRIFTFRRVKLNNDIPHDRSNFKITEHTTSLQYRNEKYNKVTFSDKFCSAVQEENEKEFMKSDHNLQYFSSTELPELTNAFVLKEPLQYHGKTFPTTEHLFQWLKYHHNESTPADLEYAETIRTSKTIERVMALGKQEIKSYSWMKGINSIIAKSKKDGVTIRKDWDMIKVTEMRDILLLKFNTNENCKKVLLSTKNHQLLYKSASDDEWGLGHDGQGQNILGSLLEYIRLQLRGVFDLTYTQIERIRENRKAAENKIKTRLLQTLNTQNISTGKEQPRVCEQVSTGVTQSIPETQSTEVKDDSRTRKRKFNDVSESEILEDLGSPPIQFTSHLGSQYAEHIQNLSQKAEVNYDFEISDDEYDVYTEFFKKIKRES